MGVLVTKDAAKLGDARNVAQLAWQMLNDFRKEELCRMAYGFCLQQNESSALQKFTLAFSYEMFALRICAIISNIFQPVSLRQETTNPAGETTTIEPSADDLPAHLGVIFAHMHLQQSDVVLFFDLLLDALLEVTDDEKRGAESRNNDIAKINWGIQEQKAWVIVLKHNACETVLGAMTKCQVTLGQLTSFGNTLCAAPAAEGEYSAMTVTPECQWLAELLFSTCFPQTLFIQSQLCPSCSPVAHCCSDNSSLLLSQQRRFAALRHRYLYLYDSDANALITIDEPVSVIDLQLVEEIQALHGPSTGTETTYCLELRLTQNITHKFFFPSDIQCDAWQVSITTSMAFFTYNPFFDSSSNNSANEAATTSGTPAAMSSTANTSMTDEPHSFDLVRAPQVGSQSSRKFKPDEDIDFEAAFRNSFPFRAKLSDFDFGKLLGAGSFGRVIKCRHRFSCRVFALKLLCKERFRGVRNVVEVRRERRALETANHPYIMKIHRIYQTKSRVYFLLDFLPSGELLRHTQRLANRHFPESYCKFYIAELACALEYMRVNRLIHRDIKGDNLVLDEHGHVILTDFGFAKIVSDSQLNKTCCGTLAYIAPEMLNGNGYGYEVDWWSTGVVLFTILTGYFPFLKSKRSETIEFITKQPLQFPPRPTITPLAEDFCRRLLQKDPRQRLRTLAQLKAHPWYAGFDWTACENKTLTPPYQPSSKDFGESKSTSGRRGGGGGEGKHNEIPLEAEIEAAAAVQAFATCKDVPKEMDIFSSIFDAQESAGSNRDELSSDSDVESPAGLGWANEEGDMARVSNQSSEVLFRAYDGGSSSLIKF